MASASIRVSPAVLRWARQSMGYDIDQTAKKAGVPAARYQAWEDGEKLPTYNQLETLADVYKRPIAILLLPSPPVEDPIQKDLRNLSNDESLHLSPELRLGLRRAKRYQLILEEVSDIDDEQTFSTFKVTINESPQSAAERFRSFIGLSINEQKTWKYEESLNNFKRKVENIGIYVFQQRLPISDARAYCLTGRFPIIVLNTQDSKNARIFSLFHEVCHILFNVNDIFRDIQSGQLRAEYKEIETYCNRFAASLLVPHKEFINEIRDFTGKIRSVRDTDIYNLSRTYNVSNEVIARKMLDLNIITEGFFWGRKRNWDAAAQAAKNQENEKLKDSDSRRDQGIKVVHEKGKPYVSKVLRAYDNGSISSSDLSNYLETKLDHIPKIIARLK